MNQFINDVLVKASASLLCAVVYFVYRIGGRVQALEAKMDAQKKDEDSVTNLTVLMTKVDTLLETALKRLDILERHVFKLRGDD